MTTMIPQPFLDLINGLILVDALDAKQAEELEEYLKRRIEDEIAQQIEYRKLVRERAPWWRRWLQW